MERILRDKEQLRKRLASKPIAEKLGILDQLRAREVAIKTGAQRFARRQAVESADPDQTY